ncbi:hypothetical protein BGX31_010808 [Mortierella sp. GBA43]|nr:hypothetical protein BGX31_010808 [Mortierella sp. GBA43]
MPIMDLMSIQFSHKVIMMCIEEIKLRGLRHPHLFRNAFHAPSVEAALAMLANPVKSSLYSVKMMRIDTVAGLLTTALSRTYPPLIPPHIQEMFHNPNGRFFFELLGMLPELNRYLFVEILDLCCALVDQQSYNQISHSKLAVFPGSCCFGRNEYKPNWDTRFLMSADLKKFSSAFYHAIYAYREERDLSEEELQAKLDKRARILEQERIAALERQHGYRGAQAILRMEARIAQGLPAESPMKEISLYADRKEKVVADDAISVLDIRLDEEGAPVPDLSHLKEGDDEPEIENVQAVLRDLRRSISIGSLRSHFESQPNTLTSLSTTIMSPTAGPVRNGHLSPAMPTSPTSPSTPLSPRSIFSGCSVLSRSNTIARSVSLKFHPVSPGDIFGISQRAVEKRELEGFLAVARSVKSKKSGLGKRSLQQRQMHKMRVLALRNSNHRNSKHPLPQSTNAPSTRSQGSLPPAAAILRRERAKRVRKELEGYLSKGLSLQEATETREADLKKQKRKEKRAKQAALAKAEAEKEAAAAAAVADAIAQHGLLPGVGTELTVEEAEILETFDYLSDQEFQEFMEIAGLTSADVDRIRAKAAALSLSKVTQDIQNVQADNLAEADNLDGAVKDTKSKDGQDGSVAPLPGSESPVLEPMKSFDNNEDLSESSTDESSAPAERTNNRPFRIPHMTSMDLLFKHASVVGDANLRLYPTRPSSPTISDYESDTMHGGLLSRAASVMRARTVNEDGDDEMDDEDSGEDAPIVRHNLTPIVPYAPRPTLATKSQMVSAPLSPTQDRSREQQDMDQITPVQQINNHQFRRPMQTVSMEPPTNNVFEFETVADYEEEIEEDEQVVEVPVHIGSTAIKGNEAVETEEEAELRELLESMSEEERIEFLRLSNPESMPLPQLLVS